MDGEGGCFPSTAYYIELISLFCFLQGEERRYVLRIFSPFVLNMNGFIRSPAKLIYDESH